MRRALYSSSVVANAAPAALMSNGMREGDLP